MNFESIIRAGKADGATPSNRFVVGNFSKSTPGVSQGGAPSASEAAKVNTPDVSPEKFIAVYIHLPFCAVKCPFCDFYTRPNRHAEEAKAYTSALISEIKNYRAFGWSKPLRMTSIYFGGGTPSLTSTKDLESILRALRDEFEWDPHLEMTIEANPEDVTQEKAGRWKDLGINRVSLGVQALSDDDLKQLGRKGTAENNHLAWQILKKTAFKCLSVDLMFGLRNQTRDAWKETLQAILPWNAEHLSCYNLTIESKTRYWVDINQGKWVPPSDEIQADMFLEARKTLAQHGFKHYEISNYAKVGYESLHNSAYWNGQNYWGIGVAAHSLQRTQSTIRRFWKPKSLQTYVQKIHQLSHVIQDELLSPEKHLRERTMLCLRTSKGVHLASLANDLECEIPKDLVEMLERFKNEGFIEKQQENLILTAKGQLFSDSLFEAFV
ncbi:MAG: radical SAM family heme chaperone HemW [Bdellovibrionales bacterium]|nr:radical SAM family heme chaperone HemW [Bdellovibrionales bacterium]